MMLKLSSRYLPGGHFSTLALFRFCPAALRPQLTHKQNRSDTSYSYTRIAIALFGATTYGCHCSRRPEWSLWPSEEDFSSGHWAEKQRKRQTSQPTQWNRTFFRQTAPASPAYLTTVRSRAERASLWKVMTTLEAGRSDFHCLCLQLRAHKKAHRLEM